ncbi:hypothetical protein OIU84_010258 [Salix udensis]|uniref:Uncharacterized protein n=1 Tax=Salix udensis TaxID=889485 RepID=A0AAD6NVN2_9ROSI|nr:hypothetical protein OIU84_010258 [Salix udensis]
MADASKKVFTVNCLAITQLNQINECWCNICENIEQNLGIEDRAAGIKLTPKAQVKRNNFFNRITRMVTIIRLN